MIPTRLGQVVEGCMFVGVNRIQSCAYAVFVSPSKTETSLPVKFTIPRAQGPNSDIDGVANTQLMQYSNYPAAVYCSSLTVNRNSDFYLPAKNELELCYRALKPTSDGNFVYSCYGYYGNLLTSGGNSSSIPPTGAHTAYSPSRTILVNTQFKFEPDWYQSSTEHSCDTCSTLIQDFTDGDQDWNLQTSAFRVRAVRRQLLVES